MIKQPHGRGTGRTIISWHLFARPGFRTGSTRYSRSPSAGPPAVLLHSTFVPRLAESSMSGAIPDKPRCSGRWM